MNEVILTTLIALGTGLAGSISTWIFGIKKQKIDNSQQAITAIDMATETWKKIVDSLKGEVADLLDEVAKTREENERLTKVVRELTDEVEKLKKSQTKLNRYENKIKELERLIAANNPTK